MPDLPSLETSPTPLLDIVGSKAIPWIEKGGMQRVVIARESCPQLVLPADVHISQKKLVGQRTRVHGERWYGNASLSTAQWPQEDQEILRVSMLICVASGRADFRIGDYILHCPEGTFIFVPPGLPHPRGEGSHLEGKNRVDGSCDLLWFAPRGRRVQCWMCHSRGTKHVLLGGHENVFLLDDLIVQYLDCMEEEALSCQADYEKMFQAALDMFLMTAYRDLQAGRFLPLGSKGIQETNRAKGRDPILQAQEYIKSHFAASLTVARVARAVHISERQFTRRFKAQTGYTFVEFVNYCRLERAQLFLRETDWSANRISEFVGYRSLAYFHAQFRRYLDMSPIEFRLSGQRESPQAAAIEDGAKGAEGNGGNE